MATQQLQIYQCNVCGNVVEVLRRGGGTLVCCGVPMALQAENTTDAAQEKHVPVIERTDEGIKVSVGSTLHPMQDDHYIEWIEVVAEGRTYRQFLQPGEEPTAVFPVDNDQVTVREQCNLHGVWKTDG